MNISRLHARAVLGVLCALFLSAQLKADNYGAFLNYKLLSTDGDVWADGYTYQLVLNLYSDNQNQEIQTVKLSDPLTGMELKSVNLKLDSSNFEEASQKCSDQTIAVGLLTYSGKVQLTPNPDGYNVNFELSELPQFVSTETIGSVSTLMVNIVIPNPEETKGKGIDFKSIPSTTAFCQGTNASFNLELESKTNQVQLVEPTMQDTNNGKTNYSSGFSFSKPFGNNDSKVQPNGEITINGLGAGNYLVALAFGNEKQKLEKRNTAVIVISIK